MTSGPCPICGAWSPRLLHEHTHALTLRAGVAPKRVHATYLRCPQCDHLYSVAQDLTDADLVEHYAHKASPLLTASTDADQTALTLIVGQLDLFYRSGLCGPPPKRVLEIGGADGHFLERLKQTGLFLESTILLHELSEDCLRVAAQRGIPTTAEPASHAPFDLVVARHTVEHVFDPVSFLRSLRSLLAPAGLAYIEVPSWVVPFGPVDGYNPEHLHQFSPCSMHWAMARAGFEVIGDFGTAIPRYATTSNRLMGFIVRSASGFADLTGFAQDGEKGFAHRFVAERSKRRELAARLRGLLGPGAASRASAPKLILHAASISLLDFLQNEGADMSLEGVVVVDGDPKKHGTEFQGHRVYAPSAELALSATHVFCFSSYLEAISRDWRALGFTGELIACAD